MDMLTIAWLVAGALNTLALIAYLVSRQAPSTRDPDRHLRPIGHP